MRNDSHRDRLIILALWVLLALWLRPWIGDLRSDQLTYACVSKEMVENNSWLFPTLEGIPYLNKPPLYFWLVALSFKAFGMSYYTAKIPSLLLATCNVFFLYWIVYRWFRDYDLAFFSAFAFVTARWMVVNSATNRPESLLVFSVLMGCHAFYLMNRMDWRGSYLLGLSFAVGFMTKLFFAFFFPLAVIVFGLTRGQAGRWIRWPHLYVGLFIGVVIPLIWCAYAEVSHPGYLKYITGYQTMQRVTEGLDVNNDPLMYVKELLMFYHPWLVFFVIGLVIMFKRRGDEYFSFIFLAIIVMAVPLQISKGKAARYLTMVTPFLSVAAALGVVRFGRISEFMKKAAVYSIAPLLIFFWTVPVRVNPEKFHVIHVAEKLSKENWVDYADFLAFMKAGRASGHERPAFVEWTPFPAEQEYRLSYKFYLSPPFNHLNDEQLADLMKKGGPVLLLTHPAALTRLPREGIRWIEIDSDRYNSLLIGMIK